MAIRTISNSGGNYNTGSTWVEGVVPTFNDNVIATSTSGQLTVNVASSAGTINFSAYTNTLSMSNTLSVFGNITLGSGMTMSGTSTLSIVSGGTLTSNNKPWNTPFSFGNLSNSIVTLTDNWTGNTNVSNNMNSSLRIAVNGNNFFCKSNLNVGTSAGIISGSTKFIMAGTGTLSGGSSATYMQNDIDISTPGTITFGPSLIYNTGTLTYISGNTITTGSTLDVRDGTTTKLQTSGMTWNNITNTNTGTVTLLSDLKLNGNLSNQTNPLVLNATGFSAYIGGGITSNSGGISGTAPLILTGSGIWQGTAAITSNLNINTSGTIQVVGSVVYNTRNLSYSAGTVITTGSTLTLGGSSTLNTNGIIWNNIQFPSVTSTTTLLSDLKSTGTTSFPNIAITTTINGNKFNVAGNLTHLNGNDIKGTTTFVFNGSGLFNGSAAGYYIDNPIILNPTGTLSISGNFNAGGNLTYSGGTVSAGTSTLNLRNTINVNTNGINWYNLNIGQANNISLLSDLIIINTATLGTSANVSLNGSNMYIGGSLFPVNGITVTGSTNIILNGTGTWSANTIGTIKNNLIVNTTGITNIIGTVYFNTGTLTYSAGTVITTGSTINSILSTTFNTRGIIWNNITFGGTSQTYTLTSDLYSSGTTTFAGSTTQTINGNNLYAVGSGSITSTSAAVYVSGTTNLILSGNSSLIGSSGGYNNSIIFAGNNNITNTIWLGGGTITNSGASVNAGTSVLNRFTNLTPLNFNTSGISFNSLVLNNTIGINSTLSTSSMTLGTTNFTGTSGFDVGTFICTTSSAIIRLTTGNTYTINSSMNTTGTLAGKITIQSNTVNTKAILNLSQGASQDNGYLSGTDIDSSGGRSIWTYKGTITRTTNWNTLSTNPKKHVLTNKSRILKN